MRFVVQDWLADTVLPWPAETGPWEVALHWAAGQSGLVCTGFDLRLRAGQPAEALTASQLRALRLQDLVRQGRQRKYEDAGGALVEAYDEAVATGTEHLLEVSPSLVESVRSETSDWSKEQQRPRLGEDHYRLVAEVYSMALDAGNRPLRAVMQHPGLGPTSKPTASRWVARAREVGLLPPTDRGRARGNPKLTPTGEEER